MIFCSNCFKDLEIKAIIEKRRHLGNCPICGSQQVSIYDTNIDTGLEGLFDSLIGVYTPLEDLPSEYPLSEAKPLADTIKHDWDIFSGISVDDISLILKELSPDLSADVPNLFLQPVGIPEKYDLDYLKAHSILRTAKWGEFVETIKHKNRFHSNLINTSLLTEYCKSIAKTIPVDKQRFYRGRISREKEGFTRQSMGAPPPDKAPDGRANSAGISRLYLTYERETTLHEIRAAEYDYITIGTFKANCPIEVVDLSRIGSISPFGSGNEINYTALAINREHLQRINEEISKTMRRGDSTLDYLPTQFICDFVMSILDENGEPAFDGIEYKSAMYDGGSNLTIFYPEKFKCTYVQTYEVTQLKYKMKKLKKDEKRL